MSEIFNNNYSCTPENDIPPIVTPVLRNICIKKKESQIITLEKPLGRGGYGTVYLCTDENGEKLAVKCIKTKDIGIPSLFEASVMSTIIHPNINSAIKIHSTSEKLYIVQHLALSDLRIYRMNNENIPLNKMVKWIWNICQGLKCLHNYDIIHGDVKTGNILIYDNGDVKLNDFNLSTKIEWDNKYKPCTSTHRPIEVWTGKQWGKEIDIWSLGCTVFEMVYGKTLFLNQNEDQSVNAILDWNNYMPQKYRTETNIKKRNVFYYSFRLPDEFSNSSEICKLIMKLLVVDSNERPKIRKIMNFKIFSEFKYTPSSTICNPVSKLNNKSKKKIFKKIRSLTSDKNVTDLAYNIYGQLGSMVNYSDDIKIYTCVWMSFKIVNRREITMNTFPFELHEILEAERTICNNLSYRICCRTNNLIIKNNISGNN